MSYVVCGNDPCPAVPSVLSRFTVRASLSMSCGCDAAVRRAARHSFRFEMDSHRGCCNDVHTWLQHNVACCGALHTTPSRFRFAPIFERGSAAKRTGPREYPWRIGEVARAVHELDGLRHRQATFSPSLLALSRLALSRLALSRLALCASSTSFAAELQAAKLLGWGYGYVTRLLDFVREVRSHFRHVCSVRVGRPQPMRMIGARRHRMAGTDAALFVEARRDPCRGAPEQAGARTQAADGWAGVGVKLSRI